MLVANPARKPLLKLPDKDQLYIEQALDALAQNPFSGDIKRLKPPGWRRRVGNYRIFYDLSDQREKDRGDGYRAPDVYYLLMPKTRKFRDLFEEMSPEVREDVEARVRKSLREMPLHELRAIRRLTQQRGE